MRWDHVFYQKDPRIFGRTPLFTSVIVFFFRVLSAGEIKGERSYSLYCVKVVFSFFVLTLLHLFLAESGLDDVAFVLFPHLLRKTVLPSLDLELQGEKVTVFLQRQFV